jgi:crotonobetaine/carnitine-CoA ligase
MGMHEKTVEAWRNLWFHTGDMGYIDERGYVFFAGRASERIRRRSENISAYEIEMAALHHPQVKEAAAVGVPSELAGDDDIKLCVVCDPQAAVDPLALTEHLVRHLPHYMVPRYIEFLDSMPRTPTSKVQRAVLKMTGTGGTNVWDRKSSGVSIRDIADRVR